jgi:hypothetical protein
MGRPSERCLTHGVADFDALGTPRRIIQTPRMIAILFEAYNHSRQIFLDGRPLPVPSPTYLFGLLGRQMEDETLVIETTCFNDRGWLDDAGHPKTNRCT